MNERRQTARLEVTTVLEVHCVDTKVPLTLGNLSSGGFSTRSHAPLPIGASLRFRFFSPQGEWGTALSARSVYSQLDPCSTAEDPFYMSGFMFLNPEAPSVHARIGALLDHATAVVTFL